MVNSSNAVFLTTGKLFDMVRLRAQREARNNNHVLAITPKYTVKA